MTVLVHKDRYFHCFLLIDGPLNYQEWPAEDSREESD